MSESPSRRTLGSVLVRQRLLGIAAVIIAGAMVLSPAAIGQQPVAVKVLAEKKVATLPVGRPRLYWRLESFSSLAQAQAAAGSWGLVAESGGKAWLATLGPARGSSTGGTKVAEIGPLAVVVAREYLIRVVELTGQVGSSTAVHTHPGSEVYYVLAGEQTIRAPEGITRVASGQTAVGPSEGTPMQVSAVGSTGLVALAMFVVDAARPFSSPASFP